MEKKHIGWKKMEVSPDILLKWIDEVCNNTKKLKSQEDWWLIESVSILQQAYTPYELTKCKSYGVIKQELRHRKLSILGV